METLLGASLPVYLGLTVVVMGGCGILTGQALAAAWRPRWAVLAYTLLIGAGDRFLVFALFGGAALSVIGFAVHTATVALLADTAYRVERATCMVRQYPWLFERNGPFGWRELEKPTT